MSTIVLAVAQSALVSDDSPLDIYSLACCQILLGVVTKDREAFIRKSIKSLLEELDPNQFMQIHRGTLINVNFIDVVERHSLRGVQVRLRRYGSALQIAQPYLAAFRGM